MSGLINLSFLKEKSNKYLVFLLIGLLVLVVAIPVGGQSEGKDSTIYKTAEGNDLEVQLARVLSAMEGVGAVEVMITTENTGNSLFSENNGNRKVCGVVIVADGAGNPVVEARISDAVKALFSIEAHKISIVKRAIQEDN